MDRPVPAQVLTWDHGTVLAMNPYTMGVVSVYASNVHNMIPLITGTGYSMLETFKPVDRWRDGFALAFDIIRKHGMFITLDGGDLIEYTLDYRGVPTFRILIKSEYKAWEERMKDSIPAFEAIHTWLTEQGVSDEGDDVIQPALSVFGSSMVISSSTSVARG